MTTAAPALEPVSRESRARTSPYQGLEPYSEEDAAYFFGRSAWREIITDHLCGYRVTVLYGASGVGKSSVLHAGVVDELRRQAKRNSELSGRPELLPVILSRWSSDPLVALADAMRSGAAAIAPELTEDPPPGSLAEVLTAWSERVGGQVLVILDQFDEYFTYYERGVGGSAFADELVEAITNRDVPAHFLFSIREDALAKLDLFEDRIPDLWQNLLRIEHLDRAAAREAIERPVERWNEREAAAGQTIELEPGLVEAVLSEAEPESVHADKAGRGRVELTEEDRSGEDLVEAPYLQLVMSRLWEEECGNGGRSIRVETLRRLGGGDRIFRSHFDSVMRSLPRRQRAVGARIFQYLVTPNGTKIALPPSALAKWAKQKEAKVATVLGTLAGGERRILRTVASADGDGETSYEIFHDRLASGILDWRRRYGRRRTIKRSLLFVVPPLAVALFAALGWVGYQKSQYADLSSSYDLLRMQDRVETVARRSPFFGAVLPAHEDTVTSVAVSPDGRRIATASDDGTVVVSRSTVGAAEFDAERERVLKLDFPSLALFSPDSRLLAVETGNEWARVWGPTGRRRFQIPASSDYTSLAFTPDGRAVLSALNDGTAHLWDVRNGKSIAVFRAPEKPLATASMSRSGRRVVTVAGKVARVWDVARPGKLGLPFTSTNDLVYAGLSPDGASLLTVSPGDARLWDVGSHRLLRLVGAGAASEQEFDPALADFAVSGEFAVAGRRDVPVYDRAGGPITVLRGDAPSTVVRFSPDGTLIATGESGGAVHIWDARTGGSRTVLNGHQGAVTSLAFSSGGGLLVSGASDGTVIAWLLLDVQTQVAKAARRSPSFGAVLSRHEDEVTSTAFSPDGRRIATVSDDGTVVVSRSSLRGGVLSVTGERVIEFDGLPTLALFSPDSKLLGIETGDEWAGVWGANRKKRFEVPATGEFDSLAFTPDGRRILTALQNGTAHLWDVGTGKSVVVFRTPEQALATASISRTGRRVVTVGGKVARIWDVARARQVGAPFRARRKLLYAALSPDGDSLLTLSAGDARLWDVRDHGNVRLAGAGPQSDESFGYDVTVLADFAPDGRFALAGRREVPLYDKSGRLVATLPPHEEATTVVRFSPDGTLLATASRDGRTRIWDTRGERQLIVLDAQLGAVNALAFSPDGKLLVTAAADGTAIVWRMPGPVS
jgi:WD40 repeat protein